MRYLLFFLLLIAAVSAQPGPPPPRQQQQPTSPIPFMVGTVTFVSSSRLTVKSEATPGSVDFKTDASTFRPAPVASGERVVVAYTGDKASAVLKCAAGQNPQDLLKTVPRR